LTQKIASMLMIKENHSRHQQKKLQWMSVEKI